MVPAERVGDDQDDVGLLAHAPTIVHTGERGLESALREP
jgi:hypothetical protein